MTADSTSLPSTAGETARSEDGRRTFWVVERFENGKSAGYWNGGSTRSFVADIDEAIQFCRRTDAYWVSRSWHWTDVQLTEHIMLDSRPTLRSEDVAVPRERTPADFAIEFAEYMAVAAINYMETSAHERFPDPDTLRDRLKALGSAVYEFRKRARTYQAALAAAPRSDAARKCELGPDDAEFGMSEHCPTPTGDVAAKLAECRCGHDLASHGNSTTGLCSKCGCVFFTDLSLERAAALEQENERLRSELQSNIGTMHETAARLRRYGKSHHELDAALVSSRCALGEGQ